MRAGAIAATAIMTFSSAASASDTWSDPFPGVRHLHRSTPDQEIYAAVVDLCAPGIDVRATGGAERGRTVSSFADLVGAELAVNADFFDGSFGTHGLAVHNGDDWGGDDYADQAPLAFGPGRVTLEPLEGLTGYQDWMEEVVSGMPTLLADGDRRSNGSALCTARHPRTAVGIDADAETLFLVVVDGRAPGRIGMTCGEVTDLLVELGAHHAMNLDGGGSSAMYLRDAGVVNRPSDGAERVVANHLAIRADGEGPARFCTRPPVDEDDGSDDGGDEGGDGGDGGGELAALLLLVLAWVARGGLSAGPARPAARPRSRSGR